jgi:putative ABC transport system ATP-binding protein
MLELNNVTKSFGARAVLRDINLTLARGEYIAIIGESGSGKSTLLNLIAGLDDPDSGQILLDGESLAALDDDSRTRLRACKLGFVFQAFHLLPHLTVAQNVLLPITLTAPDSQDSEQRVQVMLGAVGLADRADSLPRELSGGEMQRVAIARALIHRPALVLADEPTGNLDPSNARQVLELLRAQVRAHNAAAILVTHSRTAAATTQRVHELREDGLHPMDAAA